MKLVKSYAAQRGNKIAEDFLGKKRDTTIDHLFYLFTVNKKCNIQTVIMNFYQTTKFVTCQILKHLQKKIQGSNDTIYLWSRIKHCE